MVTGSTSQIGRLLDCVEEQGLADDTVVVYTSDHGEMLGEHGLWRKSNFYEQSARVPLQIRLPGRRWAGRGVDAAVSLVDLTATILDLAGVPADAAAPSGSTASACCRRCAANCPGATRSSASTWPTATTARGR